MFLLLGLVFVFQSHTNQKNFRIDLLGLGLFLFIIYTSFHWRSFLLEKRKYWDLFLTIFLTCFVFLKIAEYDPVQVLPQKMGIKVISFIWILFLLFTFKKLSENNFSLIGPFLAIIPAISFGDFMAYPSVPIAFAIVMGGKNLKFYRTAKLSTFYFPLLLILLLIFKDWWDDFALQRAILVLEGFIFFRLFTIWERQKTLFFLKSCVLYFILNSCFLIWKIFQDPNFQITSYHEDIFLIPVSLLASNALLISGVSVIIWLEPKQSQLQKYLNVLAVSISIAFLGVTISRNSILSFAVFVTIYFLFLGSPKRKLYGSIFVLSLLVLGIFIFLKTEKSVFSLGTTTIRLSIWSFYILATLKSNPFFGFGLFPENKIPFSITDVSDTNSAFFIRDYILNFNSFPLAHNLYVQVFGSFGIVGFLLVLIWFVYIAYTKRHFFRTLWMHNSAIWCLLLVWALHELYDFNTLEISNIFLLVGVFALIEFPFDKESVEKRPNPSKYAIIVIVVILTASSFRFSLVEHFTLKYSKYVIPHNFEFFLPKETDATRTNLEIPVRSSSTYQFLGNKFFFLNLALTQSESSQANLIEKCFQYQLLPAICYSKLLGYQKQNEVSTGLVGLTEYLLSLNDPFEIYKRESQ
ncbi:O-antigen ligase family protein [Leptospira sp. 2 VSF19]|uniref:O-antigen ligase family protein n=1 Tax=Leptospira soteropolitanensis TaxID=2950025 RepID=A0AAW5VE42_9LEPT|nr:O-antigen ligase family protein [Leptospira soteropolitanensis]MCW7493197.1 O-antigen ligase family protein [Leptospira soteropolitanensis]MCW7500734.1 O-antigen ligase family protein [Leptospira soteropolitanensis]MCW7523047.1 O-antigen ligase family protein [Leptospira soteropolitanensis]MCW7526846.1 O-antigen ligase family protein [Leptospira soteropolitanensis]MCW7530765.1 O-antigen ligase family protein [Leptospira soteropolitanensis]